MNESSAEDHIVKLDIIEQSGEFKIAAKVDGALTAIWGTFKTRAEAEAVLAQMG